MPTPPTGDIACAASPKHRTPAGTTRQTVDRHGQQLDVVPAFEFGHPVGEKRRKPADVLAQEASRPCGWSAYLVDSFGNDIAALPVVAAVEHNRASAPVEAPEDARRIARPARQAQPKDVHGRAKVELHEPAVARTSRMAAVGADHQIRADRRWPIRGFARDSRNDTVLSRRPFDSAFIKSRKRESGGLVRSESSENPIAASAR